MPPLIISPISLLAGAALHNRDYATFRKLETKLTRLKDGNNGWSLFSEALAAERELNWDLALEKYSKCDADPDLIDPVCLLGATRSQITVGKYSDAKTNIDSALSQYPNKSVLSEAIFVNLLVSDMSEADRLHDVLKSTPSELSDSTDCFYYYARSQPLLATGHCQAAINSNQQNHTAWSNAGYVALDNGDYASALSFFSKATQRFYSSTDKHTVTQELDLYWGMIIAKYYSGDKKNAKLLYHTVKKQYPQFSTITGLKSLPLVWSENTVKLIDKVIVDFR